MGIPDGKIRAAIEADAAGIAHVHYSAVHDLAATTYTSEVLDEWSPAPSDARYAQFCRALASGDEQFVVAEDQAGIVGFGSIVPAANELRSVYVHGRVARNGVGSQILLALEGLAASHGCTELHLHATINAEVFYSRNGYVARDRKNHRLSTGGEVACVEMHKTLRR